MPDTPNPEPTPSNTETTPQTGTGAADDASPWITSGKILGDRYEIRSLLGHGGMGEVWHAADLKLRVEVALKSLRPEFLQSERRRELLRTEVRTAREVLSPNVCRVYDLVVEAGHELLSMEYIDGITLLQLLKDRGPLELREASELAAQFLTGLDAVHEAGLVHRDFKPENVMITRSGRVVVMDFGIAKSIEAKTGTIIGTPAYMAPEQLRGETVDSRTDVFAAGVVLAEMISQGGIKERKTREDVWKGVREDPPRLPDSPWAPVLRKAVATDPRDRFPTARALVRALEEVTLRVAGSEDKHPYPGLAAFTEADADHFFGRESEVEALCRKLGRPRLLAIVGPSGAGKSSLLGAGLIPALPEGWGHIRCSPGDRPFSAVARALLPELSGDSKALDKILDFDEPDIAVELMTTWRKRHSQAILVLDQFEELFTLNTLEEQTRFAELLGRLPIEANVHVLLSMRDDFFFHCSGFPALAPIVSELTLIGAPQGGSLRRALVQPALVSGFRFEDEALVDDMIAEVSDERGALPLLAFAAARLWEKRDREPGLLTRKAHEEIGGVGGALAQHADATLDRIGMALEPTVRELFRNLVTAQGTRAIRDRDDLLSVFDDRDDAEQVLQALIDARLLTSFEVPGSGDESEPSHRVEIIHESLLLAWPRLVRWQTQDADGAQLRDQLRQVAKMWEDRGQPSDLLWTGPSYKEFEAWRERYSGGLSGTEEAFVGAMVHRAGQQRRRRTLAAAATIGALATGLAVVGAFWRSSEVARREAILQARRAESSVLVMLGRDQLESYPTGALAYAIKALETHDIVDARLLAAEVLQRGPVARIVPAEASAVYSLEMSPDGQWVVYGGSGGAILLLHRSSHSPRFLGHPAGGGYWDWGFAQKPDRLLLGSSTDVFSYSLPTLSKTRLFSFGVPSAYRVRQNRIVSLPFLRDEGEWPSRKPIPISGRDVDDPEFEELIGQLPGNALWWRTTLSSDGALLGFTDQEDSGVYVLRLSKDHLGTPPRLIARHDGETNRVAFHPSGELMATSSLDDGEIRLWSLGGGRGAGPLRVIPENRGLLSFTDDGSRLIERDAGTFDVWDLDAPLDAAPFSMRRGIEGGTPPYSVDPPGEWLVASDVQSLSFWWLGRSYPMVLRGLAPGRGDVVWQIAFAPDGDKLLTTHLHEGVQLWPLSQGGKRRFLVEIDKDDGPLYAGFDPTGRHLSLGKLWTEEGYMAALFPAGGGPARPLAGSKEEGGSYRRMAFDLDGSRVALSQASGPRAEKRIRIWDVDTGEVQVLEPTSKASDGHPGSVLDLAFVARDRLVTVHPEGVQLWDLNDGSSDELVAADEEWSFNSRLAASADGARFAVVGAPESDQHQSELIVFDLETGARDSVASHGHRVSCVALSSDGSTLVTGDSEGVVRVGASTGEAPHPLLGHEGRVWAVAVSPDGERIASVGQEGTIRVWPLPKGEPVTEQTYDELLRKLKTWTNLRVVDDSAAVGGYRFELGPFPGWEKAPDW